MLEVEKARLRGLVEVIFAGDLDASTEPQARGHWDEVLNNPPMGVLLNLRRVTFLDGRGARFLLQCYREAVSKSIPLSILTGGNRWVERPLTLLRWIDGLPLYTSRTAALNSLPGRWSPAESLSMSVLAASTPQDFSAQGLFVWRTDGRRSRLGKRSSLVDSLLGSTAGSRFDAPHPLLTCILEEDRARVLAACDPQRRPHPRDGLEYRVTDPSGSTVWLCDLYLSPPRGRRRTSLRVFTYEVSERKAQEERLRVGEQHFRTLVDLAQEAVWSMDTHGRCEYANRRMSQMLGLPCEEIIGRSLLDLVDPEDHPAVRELLRALRHGEGAHYDLRFRSSYGPPRWSSVDTRPLTDDTGRITRACVVAIDVTDRKAEEERIRGREQLLRSLVEYNGDAVFQLDLQGCLVECNRATEQLSGYRREDLLGKHFAELLSPEERAEGFHLLEAALNGRSAPGEIAILHARGFPIQLEITTVPAIVEGQVTGIFGVARDVTARKRAEVECRVLLAREHEARRLAEAAEQRLHFLTQCSRMLSLTLDFESAAQHASQLPVPKLADYCVIDGWDTDGCFRRWSVAPTGSTLAAALHTRWPFPPDARPPGPLEEVLRTGQAIAEYAPSGAEGLSVADEAGCNGEPLPSALLCLPLAAGSEVFGALTLVRTGPDRPFSAEDRALGEELARSVSLALTNARLFTAQREICRTLQESLLPPRLPEIAGFEVAASYQAVSLGTEVGGDFYDLFEMPGGAWAVVIGDVTGKGPRAASTTSLLRHTLRAVAMHARRPHRILERTNVAIQDQVTDECFSTALFVQFRSMGGRARLRLASAGHVPPLVLRHDGRVERIDLEGILLGGLPEITLSERRLELEPGDTLVLYTDGVTEARIAGRLFGEERLAELVRECAGCSAAEIVDRIRRVVVEFQHGQPADDLAVVALRFNT